MLEASFFGVLILAAARAAVFYCFQPRWWRWDHVSAFWIMVNNSWMQVPSGYVMENGAFVSKRLTKIIFNSVVWSRFPHMLLASYLTGACLRCGDRRVVSASEGLSPESASCYAWALVSRLC